MRRIWVIAAALVPFLGQAQEVGLDAAYYNAEVVPLIMDLIPEDRVQVDHTLPIYQQFPEGSQTLPTEFEARVYLVTEGAGAGNLLGLTWDGSGSPEGEGTTVFPDASIPLVNPGDFVDLGRFGPGTPLDFFVIVDANNYLGGGVLGTVSTQSSANSDGVSDHVVQLLRLLGANGNYYYAYGFEDQPGLGDGDFNDLIIALELRPVPEPSMLVLGLMAGGGAWLFRRRRRNA